MDISIGVVLNVVMAAVATRFLSNYALLRMGGSTTPIVIVAALRDH